MSTQNCKQNLEILGLKNIPSIFRNLSYEELFQHETSADLAGLEKAVLTASGALAVDTGKFTGRCPKDKYLVRHPFSEKNIWWADGKNGSDNKPITEETWRHLKGIALKQLSGKNLYLMDAFSGANPQTRLPIRVVTEVAWAAHFVKNMFLRPKESELETFKPQWTVLHACKANNPDFKSLGLNSEVFIAFNLEERMTLVGGTWYAGEIKKGIFSMMNYFLPIQGIGSFHCSANQGEKGDTALLFGLSGTGKTTLSADPKRALIGDDEHGWDDDGIFNQEGGCYAKCINLSPKNEPDIYQAIRKNALLENVVLLPSGDVDFSSNKKSENTRVSYPIDHIQNIVKPISRGGHPKKIIFLTCDAYGVLPPVSKLNPEQAMYQFLSGYTAKVAGTESGVTEPKATFSPCFGGPFLSLHPTRYADILGKKMEKHGSLAYLVNTGWSGGPYGIGRRMPIKLTRAIIDAILDGSIEKTENDLSPLFRLRIPKTLPSVDAAVLNPKNTWKDPHFYDETLKKLALLFQENFKRFTDTETGKTFEKQGPVLDS